MGYLVIAPCPAVWRTLPDCSVLTACLRPAHCLQGRVWSRAELKEVAAACARQGALLVADEIWADWVLPAAAPAERGEGGEGGERFVPCSSVAPAEGCALITLGAPTKSWSLAGLHASYLIIPDEALRRRYLQAHALATRYSLLTAHALLLTTHYSLLTTHYSLLTTHTHYSLLTAHCLLLTAHYYSLLATYCSLLTTCSGSSLTVTLTLTSGLSRPS
jgi:bifunctional pyridoxal-dependent enzyme with beta-cystathionase and maltose regulon repressor activities